MPGDIILSTQDASNVTGEAGKAKILADVATGLPAARKADGSLVPWGQAGVISPVAISSNTSVDNTVSNGQPFEIQSSSTVTLDDNVAPGTWVVFFTASAGYSTTFEPDATSVIRYGPTGASLTQMTMGTGRVVAQVADNNDWVLFGDISTDVIPSSIPGLVTDIDPAVTGKVLNTAGAVASDLDDISKIIDVMGNGDGYDFAQATASLQPRYTENLIDGRPGIQLLSSTDGLQNSDQSLYNDMVADCSIFAVMRNKTDATSNDYIINAYLSTGGLPRIGLGYYDDFKYNIAHDDGSQKSDNVGSTTDWHHCGLIKDGNLAYSYFDGTQRGPSNWDTPNADLGFAIGKHTGYTAVTRICDIARVLFYSRALTSSERSTLESYLTTTYPSAA